MNAEATSQGAPIASVTRTRIARYAAAVRDFNPVHFDDDFAAEAGLPGVIVQGPLTAALLIDALRADDGTAGSLAPVSVRFKAPVFPGETLSFARTESGAQLRKADGSVAVSATFGTP